MLPKPQRERQGQGWGREGSRGKVGQTQSGRDGQQCRQQGQEQPRGEPEAGRGGKAGETEKKSVSLGGHFCHLSQTQISQLNPCLGTADHPAAVWEEHRSEAPAHPPTAASQRSGQKEAAEGAGV